MTVSDYRVEATGDGKEICLLKGDKLIECFGMLDAQEVGVKLIVMGAYLAGKHPEMEAGKERTTLCETR